MSSKTDVLLPGFHFDFMWWMCFHSLESNIACWYMDHEEMLPIRKEGIPTIHVASTYLPSFPLWPTSSPRVGSVSNSPGVSVPAAEVCITGWCHQKCLARNSPFHWIGSRFTNGWFSIDRTDYWRWFKWFWNTQNGSTKMYYISKHDLFCGPCLAPKSHKASNHSRHSQIRTTPL